jgi:hypothetical protein
MLIYLMCMTAEISDSEPPPVADTDHDDTDPADAVRGSGGENGHGSGVGGSGSGGDSKEDGVVPLGDEDADVDDEVGMMMIGII